jgi:hypothetical protein
MYNTTHPRKAHYFAYQLNSNAKYHISHLSMSSTWHLHAPLACRPTRTPMPGCPSMQPHEPPRVISPLPPIPSFPQLPVPSWSPLPRPAASTLASPAPVPPCFQATPQWLNFSNAPSPRVVIEPRAPSPRVVIEPWHLSPLPPPVLPTRKLISHHTHSCVQAPFALFTVGQPFHECVAYHIPTAKSVWSPAEPIGFAGLCKAMQPAEIDGFVYLCQALTLVDGPEALLVLDPTTLQIPQTSPALP